MTRAGPSRERRYDERMDPWGCLVLALRFAGCMLLLVVLKFVAILIAALVSVVFL